jgi:hypothetical protein
MLENNTFENKKEKKPRKNLTGKLFLKDDN